MSRIFFHPSARIDLTATLAYYDKQQTGLARKFSDTIESALQTITTYPQIAAIVEGNVRKFVVQQFPFHIFYHESDGEIFVIAILHQRRNPDFWKARYKE
jgi:toxin ParE1/3/4